MGRVVHAGCDPEAWFLALMVVWRRLGLGLGLGRRMVVVHWSEAVAGDGVLLVLLGHGHGGRQPVG